MLGVAWVGNVAFNAASFSNRGRTFYSGQQGGLNMLRDIPRYVKSIEKGAIDMKLMVTSTYPIERTREVSRGFTIERPGVSRASAGDHVAGVVRLDLR